MTSRLSGVLGVVGPDCHGRGLVDVDAGPHRQWPYRSRGSRTNRVGRSGPAGHLDRSVSDAPAAAPTVCRQGSLHRPGARGPRSTARGDPSSRPACGARKRARRGGGLQRRVPVGAADRQTHVAGRRSPRRQAPALDRGCHQAERGGARVQAGAAAADRDLQEERCGLRRRQVRARVAAATRVGAVLQHRAPQPERRPRGSEPHRALHRCRAARLRRLSANRADARCGRDLLRHRAGTGLAARDPGWHQSTSAVIDSSALRRRTWSLGGRYARRRRHQLFTEVQLSGGARQPPSRGAVQARRCQHDRVLGDGGGSHHMDAALDGEAGPREAGRAGEPDLLRAALPRGQLRPAHDAARHAHRRARIRPRAGAGPGHQGHGDGLRQRGRRRCARRARREPFFRSRE